MAFAATVRKACALVLSFTFARTWLEGDSTVDSEVDVSMKSSIVSFSKDAPIYAESLIKALYDGIAYGCSLDPDVKRRAVYIIRMFSRLHMVAPTAFTENASLVEEIVEKWKEMLTGSEAWTTGQAGWVDCVSKFIIDIHGDIINRGENNLNPADVLKSIS